MIVQIAVLITAVKIMFIPLYHSTDFEVHRNWLALTHNLSTSKWYYEETSEWTLDYPPLFAWMEYALSQVAKYFDPKMLEISNLNYDSTGTVVFQRLSVIALDVIYFISIKRCSNLIGNGKLLVFILLVSNPGLLMVDHIHFQYNGILYGILLLSISSSIRSNFVQAAFWFTILLNMKHIYMYIAPAFLVFFFRAYCFTVASTDGKHIAWYSFSLWNLIKLAFTVIFVTGVSFAPLMDHLPQVISRLFPFKRGLCHAYWAPNFWAPYNLVDKVLQHALPKLGFDVATAQASMTGGLVQEFEHAVLPTVRPAATFVLTAVSMLPALVHLWNLCADKRYRGVNFVRCITLCATCSFMFGWHVHEKAILMILIPLSFLSVLGEDDGRMFLILSTVGHYSLFPLLYPTNLLGIKVMMLLTHCAVAFGNLPSLYEKYPKQKKKDRIPILLPMLSFFETMYIYGFFVLFMYENVVHPAWGLHKTLPFLPLMLTSVYCWVGVFYFWISYYYYFLTFKLSQPIPAAAEPKKVQ
ncbi:probable dolichyl pyrophosphate Glc1Man9GlcNAc2 alpha-1,3-glucosyltransferase [Plutella xylostella]|uniref:probable dolichyl pyrophosphate Glc1Man9GlcNAc2 alpha-1,3-glucosyltransferase n=1 Tax=Plutella xylostella TaxID=51655 RepID=UPI0020326609|nr:probable dolichyl pyrophosphate Glc1Man9GlcNAc2 alpha-1,3-glucosyltransferase [Plutella xylostella]